MRYSVEPRERRYVKGIIMEYQKIANLLDDASN